MSLREQAARAADPNWPAEAEPGAAAVERPTIVSPPLEDVSYDGRAIIDAAVVPVHVAWARVMADVQSIGKSDRRDDPGGHYNFRGVDRVVNAVGPALRRHGVDVLPVRVYDVEYREARTAKGNVMQDCSLKVKWMVVGPAGDTFPELLESAGQATDTQDKATSKATSVAQRVLFLTALHIPTDNPDVDRGHERGSAPAPKASDYRDEIADPRTSLGRLRQVSGELRQHQLANAIVTNEVGDDESLWDMYSRVVRERRGAGAEQ
ncbi:ERF family protein [Actinoplanes sp. NPDC051470]|uniref:ERF family protein n=1 Tax=Actinoplanes sp. NPDC051470 TaxID=3157224 RepID=UPI00342C1E1A